MLDAIHARRVFPNIVARAKVRHGVFELPIEILMACPLVWFIDKQAALRLTLCQNEHELEYLGVALSGSARRITRAVLLVNHCVVNFESEGLEI